MIHDRTAEPSSAPRAKRILCKLNSIHIQIWSFELTRLFNRKPGKTDWFLNESLTSYRQDRRTVATHIMENIFKVLSLILRLILQFIHVARSACGLINLQISCSLFAFYGQNKRWVKGLWIIDQFEVMKFSQEHRTTHTFLTHSVCDALGLGKILEIFRRHSKRSTILRRTQDEQHVEQRVGWKKQKKRKQINLQKFI